MGATMRDDRLLLDYFSNTNTNPIEHQEKWWVTGAVILIAGQLAFGAAVIWFLEARPPVFRLQPAPSRNQTARAYLGISDGRAFQGSRRERPCCPPQQGLLPIRQRSDFTNHDFSPRGCSGTEPFASNCISDWGNTNDRHQESAR
jgi:hypothetical protein